MNAYTRNTILYSFFTLSLVGSYWLIRQDVNHSEPVVSGPMIEINEQASEGFDYGKARTPDGFSSLNAESATILVSSYQQ
jgi:hypothetical protein